MNDLDREQLRHTILEVLADRHPAALSRKAVQNRAAEAELDFEVTLPDVLAALEFLKGLGHVVSIADELGASEAWQASSTGVRAMERERAKRIPRRD